MRRIGGTLVIAAVWALALCRCGSTSFSSSAGADSGPEAAADSPADNVIVVHSDSGDTNEGGVDTGSTDAGCAAPTTLDCSGTCVDPTTIDNCKTCGTVCAGPDSGPGHAVCLSGACGVACDSDGGDGGTEILCSGSCVSPNDPTHCGATCEVCKGPTSGNGSASCPAAACTVACSGGYHPAGTNCNTDCLANSDDPSGDPCVVADGYGVFVSPAGSDSSPGDGSKEHPFATVGHAMDQAVTGAKRVYACGTFSAEQLVVGSTRDGVTVYGGFDCTSWAYSPSTPTKMAPTAAGFALQVNGTTIGVTFEDFEFDAIAAPSGLATSAPGASSMAVIVNSSAGVVFRRVKFSAGAGQPGAKGVDGSNSWTGTAATGSPASGTTAGQGITCSCGGTGGQGGSAGAFNAGTDQFSAGGNGQDGTPLGTTNLGAGIQQIGAGNTCTAGDPNGVSAGGNGAGGSGGAGVGSLAFPQGWSNASVGGAGADGTVGQGGGGGGGYFYVVGAIPDGAGGGGGGGGCGGAHGTGGYAGGSSIPLVMLGSTVTLDSCILTAAAGGAGGPGGNGLGGQPGGGGGSGSGTGSCAGGAGGQGGTAGAGGGGVGGDSIAVAYSGTAPTHVGTVTENVAPAASGGSPGGGNSTAISQGNPGLSVAEQSF